MDKHTLYNGLFHSAFYVVFIWNFQPRTVEVSKLQDFIC